MPGLVEEVFSIGCCTPGFRRSVRRMGWDRDSAARLGAELWRLRTERGLSQQALAFRATMSPGTVQSVEACRSPGNADSPRIPNPTMATLVALAGALDVPIAELLRSAGL